MSDTVARARALFQRAHAAEDHTIANQTKRSDGTPRAPLMMWCCAGLALASEADQTHARLAAVRAVLGARHVENGGYCVSGCVDPASAYEPESAPWPCLHERIWSVLDGELS